MAEWDELSGFLACAPVSERQLPEPWHRLQDLCCELPETMPALPTATAPMTKEEFRQRVVDAADDALKQACGTEDTIDVDVVTAVINSTLSTPQRMHLYHVSSMLVNSYAWCAGEEHAPDAFPRSLSLLICSIARVLGTQPIVTHASVVLYNCVPITTWQAVKKAEDMKTLHTFTGSEDEKWFYLVTAMIELEAVPALKAMQTLCSQHSTLPSQGVAVVSVEDVRGEVVLVQESKTGAVHINTSNPEQGTVMINGANTSELYNLAQAQHAVIAAQQRTISAQERVNAEQQAKLRALQGRVCAAARASGSEALAPSLDMINIAGLGMGLLRWVGGVLLDNGRIFAAPFNFDRALVVDTVTHAVDTTSFTFDREPLDLLYANSLVGSDGRVLAFPGTHREFPFRLNPRTNATETGQFSFRDNTSDGLWVSGVVARNGKMYGVPFAATSVLILDPVSNDTDTTAMSGLSSQGEKWISGVLADNGKLYCIPSNADAVLVIDPEANSTDATTLTVSGDTHQWRDGVLAGNGLIFGIPYDHAFVLVINPALNTTDYASIGSFIGQNKWAGGVFHAATGRIFAMPYSDSSLLIIDTATNGTATMTVAGGESKWSGAVLADNGLIYAIPSSATSVLVIDPGC
ncbi:hypothetical protein PTSG_13026 [Salpingoeca rosetta]|uniref:Uncharacterized protein n=1 Tax=Salpingoeca rosetta (strain ATCC 50818 / BSB-021) TaxID=946362 RepID=F2UR08_SALR5|nr:uncharacterized protein PTSG_13026 [Salpingoeca rosetta]EGD80063.1 hypothetical protein PTSG_13026 [Salpingoeca rosetta]|eukprot:XP_004988388.1 hypothetical protein PTSG_13026 [Salpingoeca rosetta]